MTSLNGYQNLAAQTAVYPGAGEALQQGQVTYCVMGLVGEAGEIANETKKVPRDDGGILTHERRLRLISELGDVLWYVAQLATELNVSLEVVAETNLTKLQGRQATGTLHGSGEHRTTLNDALNRRH